MIERRVIAAGLRWTASLAILAAVAWWLDVGTILASLGDVSATWIGAAVSVTIVQTLVSAWRWRFTSARLGLSLPWGRAVGEYYLALFVNQVFPGGVGGDALRAHRHARSSKSAGPAWRAVVIERGSGQAVVALATFSVLTVSPTWRGMLVGMPGPDRDVFAWAGLLALFLAALAVAAVRRWPGHWRSMKAELHAALWSSSAWPRQLLASSFIVLSYALVFALVGRGIGVEAGFVLLLVVALPILLAMLVPLSVGGWGFREVAAASVWLALGLPAEQGVAVAIAYGLVVLAASLPGAIVLVMRPRA